METSASIRDFLESRNLTCRPTSLALYRHCLGTFDRWLAEQAEPHLDVEVLTRYLAGLKARGLGDQTVRGHYRMLKTFCRWMVDRERLIRDPFAGRGRVPVPPLRRRRVRCYSDAEIARLLTETAIVAGNKRNFEIKRQRYRSDGPFAREGLQARALVLVLADTAMRAAEVSSLSCGQVRAEEIVIVGKGGHEGVIFFSPTTRALVEELIAGRADDEPVFLDWDGCRANTRVLRGIVERLARRAGVELPERPLHSFRHYACRKWTEGGLSTLTIKQLMRHAQLSTTELYCQLDAGALARLHLAASPVIRLLETAGLGADAGILAH